MKSGHTIPVLDHGFVRYIDHMGNLIHFITLREDSHAQAEIQEYSRAIKLICAELFPWTIEAYELFSGPNSQPK